MCFKNKQGGNYDVNIIMGRVFKDIAIDRILSRIKGNDQEFARKVLSSLQNGLLRKIIRFAKSYLESNDFTQSCFSQRTHPPVVSCI